MTTDNINTTAGELSDTLDRTGETLREKSTELCSAISKETSHLVSCASKQIRENPLPAVLGAVGIGVAIGCLLMSGRQSPEERFVQEPLDQAGDAIRNSLSHLYNSLKFW